MAKLPLFLALIWLVQSYGVLAGGVYRPASVIIAPQIQTGAQPPGRPGFALNFGGSPSVLGESFSAGASPQPQGTSSGASLTATNLTFGSAGAAYRDALFISPPENCRASSARRSHLRCN